MRLSPFSTDCRFIKKKPFLLLEVLIAILLLSLCLIPLIQGPIATYRAEMQNFNEMEGERLAEWSFSEVKQKLLNQEIPWDKLPSLGQKTNLFPLPPATLEIPGSKPKKIQRSFQLRCGKKGEKSGLKGEIYRMLHVDIVFIPRLSQKPQDKERGDYSYRLMVRQLPGNPN